MKLFKKLHSYWVTACNQDCIALGDSPTGCATLVLIPRSNCLNSTAATAGMLVRPFFPSEIKIEGCINFGVRPA